RQFICEKIPTVIHRTLENPVQAAISASRDAAECIRQALEQRGRARIVAATGTSQLKFLSELVKTPGIDWKRVILFHLDEYLGLPPEHPGSMHRYLVDRFLKRTGITQKYLLDGNSAESQARAAAALVDDTVDIAF